MSSLMHVLLRLLYRLKLLVGLLLYLRIVTRVETGEVVGHVSQLVFRDPDTFRAGELHRHFPFWETIAGRHPSPQQHQVLGWIRNKVSLATYFRHFMGSFQGEHYDSDLPPPKLFANNGSCKSFTQFIRKTLLARLRSGAISLVGRVGYVTPPHLVIPLTVEPGKPRLCHDARFLNLWMEDKSFTLDRLGDLPRYVSQDSYQTVLDDKSGYAHIFLSEEVVRSSVSSGEVGILPTILCPLGGRFRRLCITLLVYYQHISFDRLVFRVLCTSMIGIMVSFKPR